MKFVVANKKSLAAHRSCNTCAPNLLGQVRKNTRSIFKVPGWFKVCAEAFWSLVSLPGQVMLGVSQPGVREKS